LLKNDKTHSSQLKQNNQRLESPPPTMSNQPTTIKTVTTRQWIKCSLCPKSEKQYNKYEINLRTLRNHYKTHHTDIKFSARNYTSKGIKQITRKEKAIIRMRKSRCDANKSIRFQCSYLKEAEQCKLTVTSKHWNNGYPRCRHHPLTGDSEKQDGANTDNINPDEPHIEPVDTVTNYNTVSTSAIYKRKRTARLLGLAGTDRHQCYHFRGPGETNRCRNRLMTDLLNKQEVRCPQHMLRTTQFASLHGIYVDPKSNSPSDVQYCEVKESTIDGGGLGVFTCMYPLRKNDIITQYEGTLLTKEQFKHGLHNPQHTMLIKQFTPQYLSGITTPVDGKGMASFINRADQKVNLKNVEFVFRGAKTNEQTVWARATTNISVGSELFGSYGNGFRLIRPKDITIQESSHEDKFW
jgi:hypothetical protein